MLSSISSSSGTDSNPSSPPNGSLKGSLRTADQHLSLTEDLLLDTKKVELDGYGLSLGEVVAVGRNGVEAKISDDEGIKGRIEESVEFLRTKVSFLPLLSCIQNKGSVRVVDAPGFEKIFEIQPAIGRWTREAPVLPGMVLS